MLLMRDECCCDALKEAALVTPGNFLVKLSTVAILAAWALAAFEAHRIFAGSEPGEGCLVYQQNRC